MKRKPYPSDLTDEQWALLEPLLPDAKPGGHPRTTNLREALRPCRDERDQPERNRHAIMWLHMLLAKLNPNGANPAFLNIR